MRLSEWAKQNRVSRQSTCRWFHSGVLPVPTRQLPRGTIVVEPLDRLALWVEYPEAAWSGPGRRLVVVEEAEASDDSVRDIVELLTNFCARLFGGRSVKRRAQEAVETAARAA